MIVTTPEKWDIITRKSGDRTYTQLVRLLIIDEIHLLHDNRGPVLESIVVEPSGKWRRPRRWCAWSGSLRPSQFRGRRAFLREPGEGTVCVRQQLPALSAQQQFIGVTVKKPLQRFQLMNDICYEKVMENGAGAIIWCTAAETAKTAKAMRDTALENDQLAKFLKDDSASREILVSEAEQCRSADLRDVLRASRSTMPA